MAPEDELAEPKSFLEEPLGPRSSAQGGETEEEELVEKLEMEKEGEEAMLTCGTKEDRKESGLNDQDERSEDSKECRK
ncbi:hypothetical protein BHE74_00042785 [Ensete ventricosum]|nr:hypothetical protein BHE74_00042785 [Ensete ventricosum]